jgi:hypothetical protein
MAPRNFQIGIEAAAGEYTKLKPTNHQHEGILLIAGR